jgi:Flp pilus assembly protein TadG
MTQHRRHRRRGATLVEFSLVASVLFLLLIGMIVLSMGIFRAQQTAFLARQAARFASTHAGQYQHENAAAINNGSLPNVDDAYLKANIVQANAVGLDSSSLAVAVNFNTASGSYDWDDTANNGQRYPYSLRTVNGTSYSETNTVSVTVTYQWTPEWLFGGPITFTSTAVMPVCY